MHHARALPPPQVSIICTIGPKTKAVEKLTDLRKAGMNVVRMNFSHGSYDYHGEVIKNARESQRLHPLDGRPIAIALDTKGPEIRTGLLEGAEDPTLEKGKSITLHTDIAWKPKCSAEVRGAPSSPAPTPIRAPPGPPPPPPPPP